MWSVIDSDVAGLAMALSREAAASSAAGEACNKGDSGDETGEMMGRYLPDIGDAANTGNTSIVSRSKSTCTTVAPMTSVTPATPEG